ncbi:hypothetical protein [Streptomyces narbonensis]
MAGAFLRAGSLTRSDADVELLSDYRRIQQVLEDITDVIQHSLASMHPTSLVREVAERVLSRDRRQIENGVRAPRHVQRAGRVRAGGGGAAAFCFLRREGPPGRACRRPCPTAR